MNNKISHRNGFIRKPLYYEYHITFIPNSFSPSTKLNFWKHSKIDGDSNLGQGVKNYYTLQTKDFDEKTLMQMVKLLEDNGCEVLRYKIEHVVYDYMRI